jgi:pimeloyl-ACP methyl ester carboxylesterase
LSQKILSLSSGSVVYEQHGTGPHNLVLIHGAPGRPEDFNALTTHNDLKKLTTCYQIALPGYGYTPKSSGKGSTIAELGEFILQCIDQLGLERFSILGHSLGGSIAIYVAQKRSVQCRQLILISSVGKRNHSGLYIGKATWLLKIPLLGSILEQFLHPLFLLLGFPKKLSLESIHQTLEQTQQYSIKDQIQNLACWKAASNSSGRTVVIYGKKDRIINTTIQEELIEYLNPHKILSLHDGHHNPQKEFRAEVSGVLIDSIS